MSYPWTVEKTSDVVSTIKVEMARAADWEQWVLLRSDGHFDNPKAKNDLAHRHLKQAVERKAPICDFGDLFCAMQGRNDRRGSKSSIKDENQQQNYFGSLIKDATKFLEPYRDNLAVIGTGNHETAVLKNNEIDLTESLIDRLNDKGSQCVPGGYRGWIKFAFSGTTYQQTVNMYYTHGGGGGGPVTKGVIKTNRRAVFLPDAHIVVGGHIHEAWQLEMPRIRLTRGGREYADDQLHICLPTYKEEFLNHSGGFHHEGERPPKPLGAQWLRFFYCPDSERVQYQCIRAK